VIARRQLGLTEPLPAQVQNMRLRTAQKWPRHVTFDGIARRSFSDARDPRISLPVKHRNLQAERLSI